MDKAGRGAGLVAAADPALPLVPDYGGACLSEVVPLLLGLLDGASAGSSTTGSTGARGAPAGSGDGAGRLPSWAPTELARARQVVLLVLDGLGWEQLEERGDRAPTLAAMRGGPITSVAPTTTASALTSLAVGLPPAAHGVVGYRIAEGRSVLNVLKWATAEGDARRRVPPGSVQASPPFLGRRCPVVTRAEFAGSGFTEAHLSGAPIFGWRVSSSLAVEVGRLVRAGERFVYAYYDGVDKVAHDTGLGEHYGAELRAADRLVADLLAVLPRDCALAVTADHGQVEVRSAPIELDGSVSADVELLSGEARFRWLHARPGAAERLAGRCRDLYGDVAWVRTRAEVVAERWLGEPPAPKVARRLGDVALVAREPVAFFDPADTGELRLVSRHGSLTSAEMLVPFLASLQ